MTGSESDINGPEEQADGQEVAEDTVVSLEINGVLDLHAFSPKEVKQLVADYLTECRKLGIYEVRIIHGKGSGELRRTVHGVLDRLPRLVKSYQLAGIAGGGWGATLIDLCRD